MSRYKLSSVVYKNIRNKLKTKKGTQLRIPFLYLLLDYVPKKEEALTSLYVTKVQIKFHYCNML
jgi:hypothetical protein